MENTYLSSGNFDNGPVFLPGVVYTEQYLLNVGIAKRTLERWKAAGLKARRPGTKQAFYLSDDVISIFRLDPGDIPDYEPGYKRKPKKKE